MWREKGMFLYVYHKGVDKPRNNLIASFTNKQYFFIRMNVKGLLHCITDNPLTSLQYTYD